MPAIDRAANACVILSPSRLRHSSMFPRMTWWASRLSGIFS
jgi:hypothetical protein